MKPLRLSLRVFLLACPFANSALALASLQAPVPAELGAATKLFDGKTLEGWGGLPELWSVREGLLVGSTVDHPLSTNTFLIWQGGEVDNFVLRAKLRIEGDNNSGIQYRSQRVDGTDFALAGYQCDVHPHPAYLGMLYSEQGGRGILAERGQMVRLESDGVGRVLANVGTPKNFRVGDWNEFTIIAAGNHVLHQVNGITTVDVLDLSGENRVRGELGLQLHAGAPMTLFAKDIVLLPLSLEAAEAVLAKAASETQTEALELSPLDTPPLPSWIWGQDPDSGQSFRCEFPVKDQLVGAWLDASSDNVMKLWINGVDSAYSANWESPLRLEIRESLRPGTHNVLAFRAENRGGPAGLFVKLRLVYADGSEDFVLTGNDDWRVSSTSPLGWQNLETPQAGWSQPTVLGQLGCAPWGLPGARWAADADETTALTASPPAPALKVIDGFRVELLYTAPKGTLGSWVSLAKDPMGRLYASDQGGAGLARITLAPPGQDSRPLVEPLRLGIAGAQGMVWYGDSLYVHTGEGLYRLTDRNGDDRLDLVDAHNGARGDGEHGNHALLVDEERHGLFVVAGNHTELPSELVVGSAVTSWQEDLLLPREWDANGHARGLLAPGGWICRSTLDGREYRVHCIGFRNVYDVAQNRFGDLFAFDADMEWDMGLPWYRPTRICLAASGADFGWRSGSGKWPAYYEDSLPALLDIGPGSPTGMVAGTGTRFPTRYQDAVFALDWTFGTMYAVHLEPEGAGYRATAEEFLAGAPLPLTDAVVGDDGALYFVTGGRGTQSGLYRVVYVGNESTAPPGGEGPPAAASARAQRRRLEVFHGLRDPAALDAAWPFLASPDRYLRNAARVAVEAQPVATWAERAFQEQDPQAKITLAVALARSGDANLRERQTEALLQMPFETLDESQALGWLRAMALTCLRLGGPSADQRDRLIVRLMAQVPSKSVARNTECMRLLVYLDAPGVIEKGMALIAARTPETAPAWGDLVTRNHGYGGPIARMLENPPPQSALGYAFLLRNLRYGWSLDERKEFFTFLNEASTYPGGNSYRGFLENLREDALANTSAAERAALGELVGSMPTPELGFSVHAPKGPGRTWTVESASQLFKDPATLQGRDFAQGRNLFHAVACAACHRFDGQGGAIGPDLTTVRNKFQLADLLESMIEPSKVISDQYGSSRVTLHEGTSFTGLVVEHGDQVEVYGSDVKAAPTVVDRKSIANIERVDTSQMPGGLLNSLAPDELCNLVAYLMSRGNPEDPMFR